MKRHSLWLLVGAGLAGAVLVAGPASAAPTPVACGGVITAPGDYRLTGSCTASGHGIEILASKVHLKLNGYTLTGSGGATGILVHASKGVHIQGPGTVTGFFNGFGTIGPVTKAHVEKLTAVGNVETGIALGGFGANDNHLSHNVANGNGVAGIRLFFFSGFGDTLGSDRNHVAGNVANGNGVVGIRVDDGSDGNHLNGNDASGNGGVDLSDGAADCDGNKWKGNDFTTADASCIS